MAPEQMVATSIPHANMRDSRIADKLERTNFFLERRFVSAKVRPCALPNHIAS